MEYDYTDRQLGWHVSDFLPFVLFGVFWAVAKTDPVTTDRHGGMRDNMMKAMMVLNWLNTIDTSRH